MTSLTATTTEANRGAAATVPCQLEMLEAVVAVQCARQRLAAHVANRVVAEVERCQEVIVLQQQCDGPRPGIRNAVVLQMEGGDGCVTLE